MKKNMLIAVVLGLIIGLTSCENFDGGSAGGAKSAVSLLDKVIGQEYASAEKAVEGFGIPFWENNRDEYVFTDGESDDPVPVVRLFVSNGVVYKATYELENEGNMASCDNIITQWTNKLNNHKIGEYEVRFAYAINGTANRIEDFSQLSNFIKNSTDCNVYFNVGEQYANAIGRIIINKGYEDNTYDEDFYWAVLTYEWNK